MIGGDVIPPRGGPATVSVTPLTAFFLGAFTAAVAAFVIYLALPKPAFLDVVFGWLYAGRDDPHEQPTTSNTPDDNPIHDEPQNLSARRSPSPTGAIQAIMFGSEYSTPEPPLLDSSEEEESDWDLEGLRVWDWYVCCRIIRAFSLYCQSINERATILIKSCSVNTTVKSPPLPKLSYINPSPPPPSSPSGLQPW